MSKCVICGQECSDRADTCGPACRKAKSRQSVTQSVTIPKCDKRSVTHRTHYPTGQLYPGDAGYPLGLCGHCRQPTDSINLTCCLPCSMAGKGKVAEAVKAELGIGKYCQDTTRYGVCG